MNSRSSVRVRANAANHSIASNKALNHAPLNAPELRRKSLDLAIAVALSQMAWMPALTIAQTPPARAPLPSGANIVQGANAPVVQQQTMTIDQTAPRAIINWNSFNIAPGHQVRINQQGQADWAILNRVVGTERSVLQGVLQADGQVFLLNNNGIMIGRGAQINVHSFIASTLTITDKLFKDGLLSGSPTVPAFIAGSGRHHCCP
jgi:filamentous hemagglutinin family protein